MTWLKIKLFFKRSVLHLVRVNSLLRLSAYFNNSSFGGGGCGVYGRGHRLSHWTDRLKSFLSSHEVSVGQLFLVLLYMTGQDRWFWVPSFGSVPNLRWCSLVGNDGIQRIIKLSTSDNAFRVLWLVHSILVISSYTLVWPYMVNDCAKRC